MQLAVRAPYAALAPYLDRRLSVVKLDIDPYRIADDTATRLEALRERLLAEKPDLLVSAAYTRSFSEEWLLRRLGRANRRVRVHAGRTRARNVGQAGTGGRAGGRRLAPRSVHAPEESHEPQNAALGAAILGRNAPGAGAGPSPPGCRAIRRRGAAVDARAAAPTLRARLPCRHGQQPLEGVAGQGFADQVETPPAASRPAGPADRAAERGRAH